VIEPTTPSGQAGVRSSAIATCVDPAPRHRSASSAHHRPARKSRWRFGLVCRSACGKCDRVSGFSANVKAASVWWSER
jgi:hypothetical protein